MNDSGNLPPQSIELEQAILGAVMLEKGTNQCLLTTLIKWVCHSTDLTKRREAAKKLGG